MWSAVMIRIVTEMAPFVELTQTFAEIASCNITCIFVFTQRLVVILSVPHEINAYIKALREAAGKE